MAEALQTLDDSGARLGFHLARQQLAGGGDGFVAIAHHPTMSRVTRSTSSIEVTPATALRRPSSYIERMPSLAPVRWISPDSAWRSTRRRIASVMVRNSMTAMRPL